MRRPQGESSNHRHDLGPRRTTTNDNLGHGFRNEGRHSSMVFFMPSPIDENVHHSNHPRHDDLGLDLDFSRHSYSLQGSKKGCRRSSMGDFMPSPIDENVHGYSNHSRRHGDLGLDLSRHTHSIKGSNGYHSAMNDNRHAHSIKGSNGHLL
jgi:hypothetical protein